MVSQSRTAKRSVFNPIPWIFAIALLIGIFTLLATEAKAGSVDATGAGTVSVNSPSLTPPSIGWELDRTQVSGTKVTWTPKASGSYTINVVVGDSVGTATVWASGSEIRTDSVTIIPALDARFVENANLVISEN
ncbi:MAG: hypothetical protein BZY81_02745 [SAR202 cluster bacterium Io17-Chloro-G4]|nr:MAG: hypothetical protein BZY81_02745 [SAR202 cluster bacterium Io17-Chloro-G4]